MIVVRSKFKRSLVRFKSYNSPLSPIKLTRSYILVHFFVYAIYYSRLVLINFHSTFMHNSF
uniref:Uncharacterized protein n=1 Tax=Heterorhabditis bacteriophora TaxID=37862 RepID=A0A1I7WWH4_HETBA